jgi:ABC-type multidrug transport system ATPase subunit
VLRIAGVKKSFGDKEVLHGVDLLVRRGDRVAIMGPNGIGKSTLLKIAMGELEPDAGKVEWGYEAHPGYFAQDVEQQLGDADQTAEEWLWAYCPGRDRGYVRGQMGLVLFSGDDGKKRTSALSGGEAARLVFARLAIQHPNVLVLDEPTNHLDLESIEALVESLKSFEGTLILVSHDRWFVSRLATRVVEITRDDVRDYLGTYEEYVHQSGDDHLDADAVVLKARKEKRRKTGNGAEPREAAAPRRSADAIADRKRLEKQRDTLVVSLDAAEARIAAIDEVFCRPGYYDETPQNEVSALEDERVGLRSEIERLTADWDAVERALDALAG